MTRLVITKTAAGDLEDLIDTHNLPDSTLSRVAALIAPLQSFPSMGVALSRRMTARRFLVGPWPWMVILYRYDQASDAVLILSIEDGRASTSATMGR